MVEQRMSQKKEQNENYLWSRTGFFFLSVLFTDAFATPGHILALVDYLINASGHRGTRTCVVGRGRRGQGWGGAAGSKHADQCYGFGVRFSGWGDH